MTAAISPATDLVTMLVITNRTSTIAINASTKSKEFNGILLVKIA